MNEKRRAFWRRFSIPDHRAKLGQGRYGEVIRATEIATGREVAIKKVVMEDLDRGLPSTSMREVSILRLHTNSPYIMSLLDAFYDVDYETGSREMNLVFDFMNCDLDKYIRQQREPFSPRIIKRLILMLLKGTYHLHSTGMFHRDLKPKNILIDDSIPGNPVLKIADLGLGRTHAIPIRCLSHEIGSLHYRAPEVLLGSKYYAHAVDMWSIGCIFAELLTRRTLFCADTEYRQLLSIFSIMGTPDLANWPVLESMSGWHDFPQWKENQLRLRVKYDDPLAVDLLEKLIAVNPSDRITVIDALNHEYLKPEANDEDSALMNNFGSHGSSSTRTENFYPGT